MVVVPYDLDDALSDAHLPRFILPLINFLVVDLDVDLVDVDLDVDLVDVDLDVDLVDVDLVDLGKKRFPFLLMLPCGRPRP